MCSAKDRYTLIEQSANSRITCMQYSQKNFMRIIGNDQKNNGLDFWEILERIIGKISSIIGAALLSYKGKQILWEAILKWYIAPLTLEFEALYCLYEQNILRYTEAAQVV